MEKILGKISKARFGFIENGHYSMGLILEFKMDSSIVGCGGRYTVNIHKDCKYKENERAKLMEEQWLYICYLLMEANVDSIEKLINIPVEVTIDCSLFKSFRILTEVL